MDANDETEITVEIPMVLLVRANAEILYENGSIRNKGSLSNAYRAFR